MTRTTRFLRTILQLRHILFTEALTFTAFSPRGYRRNSVSPKPELSLFSPGLNADPAGYRTTPVRP